MPTATVKPGGGGDYTSLTAWENAVDGLSADHYIAECDDSGDLGTVACSSWTSGSTATIRAASGDEHGGSLSAGAYITKSSGTVAAISISNTGPKTVVIEGLRISETTGGTAPCINPADNLASYHITVNRCLIHSSATAPSIGIQAYRNGGSTVCTIIIRNCILYASGPTTPTRSAIFIFGQAVSSGSFPTIIQNNTIFANNGWTRGIHWRYTSTTAAVVNIDNNLVVGTSSTDFYEENDTANTTITLTRNLSEDATADDNGGTANLISKVAADQVVNVNSDWSLLDTGDAYEAGTDLSASFTDDAYGNTRSTPWHIGAWGGVIGGGFVPTAEFYFRHLMGEGQHV